MLSKVVDITNNIKTIIDLLIKMNKKSDRKADANKRMSYLPNNSESK